MQKYRIVLTCFDNGREPYEAFAECEEELFSNENDAYTKARLMATEECANLNEESYGLKPSVGCYEVDDSANNDFEIRWYEKPLEARVEDSCDIEYVTTYNIYPLNFNDNGSICQYRGFVIKQDGILYNVSKNNTVFGGGDSLLEALMVADDLCLECSKDKTCALEAVHKVPLDILLKLLEHQKESGQHSFSKECRDVRDCR